MSLVMYFAQMVYVAQPGEPDDPQMSNYERHEQMI
jgi:hypothetical protein